MFRLLDHIILCVFVVGLCGPVIWLFARLIEADMSTIFARLADVGPGLWAMFVTTVFLGVATSLTSTALSFLTAFSLVFCKSRFAALCLWLSVATLYFPIEARMLKTFDVVSALNLTSTMAGLVLPTLQLALGTLFFRQHFKSFPPALLEAARLDGAGPLRFLRDFAVPLSKLHISLVAFVTFVWGLNQYLWPLMVSVDDRHWTILRALRRVNVASDAGLLLASMSMVPPLLLILLMRKRIFEIGSLRP